MLEKYEQGTGPSEGPAYDEYLDFDEREEVDEDEEEMRYDWSLDEFEDYNSFRESTEHWRGPDGPIDLSLPIDVNAELLNADPDSVFYKLPSRHKYEGWNGNDGCTLEHWYQTGVVCFWPFGQRGRGKEKDPAKADDDESDSKDAKADDDESDSEEG